MTLVTSGLIEKNRIYRVSDLESWWRKIDQGYIGVQDGNTTRLYFNNKDGSFRQISPFVSGRFDEKVAIESDLKSQVHENLVGVGRNFWAFDARYLKKENFRRRLIQAQGGCINLEETLSKLITNPEYDEELL